MVHRGFFLIFLFFIGQAVGYLPHGGQRWRWLAVGSLSLPGGISLICDHPSIHILFNKIYFCNLGWRTNLNVSRDRFQEEQWFRWHTVPCQILSLSDGTVFFCHFETCDDDICDDDQTADKDDENNNDDLPNSRACSAQFLPTHTTVRPVETNLKIVKVTTAMAIFISSPSSVAVESVRLYSRPSEILW